MFHQPSVVQPAASLSPMATPTRLPVLLQRRKSAQAGAAANMTSSSAGTAARNSVRMRRGGAGKANAVPSVAIERDVAEALRAVNDDGAEVVHVGVGRAGLEQVAETREKAGGIVVGEERGRIETERLR